MEIFTCEQNSPEWVQARLGIPTSSQFQAIMTKRRNGAPSKTRHTYLMKLAGERVTREPMDSVTTFHMQRGKDMEAEAAALYAFLHDVEPQRVGFIRNGEAGASPDALIGDSGMLEIKTKLPHLLLAVSLEDVFPAEHYAQCQGQLWIAERDWIDLLVYWPGVEPFIKRAHRDEPYIAELAKQVAAFNAELDEVVERIRAQGVPPEAAVGPMPPIPAALRREA